MKKPRRTKAMPPMTPEDIDDVLRTMEAKGLVRDTGERREGHIVWQKIRDSQEVDQSPDIGKHKIELH